MTDLGKSFNASQKVFGPLIAAVKAGDIGTVRELLRQGSDVNGTNGSGYTALMWAVYEGNTEIMRLLLEKGAHVNATNNYGSTALIWAAKFNGTVEAVRLLIDSGADLDMQGKDGRTALDHAKEKRHKKVEAVLLEAIEARAATAREVERLRIGHEMAMEKQRRLKEMALKRRRPS